MTVLTRLALIVLAIINALASVMDDASGNEQSPSIQVLMVLNVIALLAIGTL